MRVVHGDGLVAVVALPDADTAPDDGLQGRVGKPFAQGGDHVKVQALPLVRGHDQDVLDG